VVPWFAQPRAEELRGGLMAAAASHSEQRGSAELCSVLQRQGLRERHGAVSGEGQVQGLGKVQRAGIRLPMAVVTAPCCWSSQEHLHSALKHRVWVVLCGGRSWTLIFVGPF